MIERQDMNADGHRKRHGLGIAMGAAGTLTVLGLAGLAVVYTGVVNVAATEEHSSLVRWAFETTLHKSVERHAADAVAPEPITPDMVAAGAAAYKSTCQTCHAGPGVERAKWATAMRPRPPRLTEAATHLELREVFWLAKHGVRMSGMPAFGPTHDDRALWGIAAFVKALPAMTPERYADLGGDHVHDAGAHTGSTR